MRNDFFRDSVKKQRWRHFRLHSSLFTYGTIIHGHRWVLNMGICKIGFPSIYTGAFIEIDHHQKELDYYR